MDRGVRLTGNDVLQAATTPCRMPHRRPLPGRPGPKPPGDAASTTRGASFLSAGAFAAGSATGHRRQGGTVSLGMAAIGGASVDRYGYGHGPDDHARHAAGRHTGPAHSVLRSCAADHSCPGCGDAGRGYGPGPPCHNADGVMVDAASRPAARDLPPPSGDTDGCAAMNHGNWR